MPRGIELQPGDRFGRLTVLAPADGKNGFRRYRCRCDCAAEMIACGAYLKSGNTKSCGCLVHRSNKHAYKHGHNPAAKNGRPSRTYRSWDSMIGRCLNPRDPYYSHYGGRGIAISGLWLGEEGFANFLADMGERPEGTSIDRINNDGNYEPSNCQWATPKEQRANQRHGRNNP